MPEDDEEITKAAVHVFPKYGRVCVGAAGDIGDITLEMSVAQAERLAEAIYRTIKFIQEADAE